LTRQPARCKQSRDAKRTAVAPDVAGDAPRIGNIAGEISGFSRSAVADRALGATSVHAQRMCAD
jgi:hypothetical protein